MPIYNKKRNPYLCKMQDYIYKEEIRIMRMLLVGAGAVGESILRILKKEIKVAIG